MANQKLLSSLEDSIAIYGAMDQLQQIAAFLCIGSKWTPALLIEAYLSYGVPNGWNIAQTKSKMIVINGQIAYSASTMFGLAISSQMCKSWKEVKSDDKECTYEFKRADNNQTYTVSFTIEMARQQGLTNNRNWTTMPTQMLRARCKSMAVRDVFPDSITGYDGVELADSMDLPEHEKLAVINDQLDTSVQSSEPKSKTIKTTAKSAPAIAQVQPTQPQVQPTQPVQSSPTVVVIGQEHKNLLKSLTTPPMPEWENISVLNPDNALSEFERVGLENILIDDYAAIKALQKGQTHKIAVANTLLPKVVNFNFFDSNRTRYIAGIDEGNIFIQLE
jgi:hypothetical protein